MVEVRDIDLNLLVVFQEIFQERQISAVAKRLGLSQSAVSNALARLRRTCNDELFVRTAQGMQPTPFAEQLAEPIASALAQVTRALNREQEFDPATSQRQFTIAMTDVGEVYFMPVLMEKASSAAPQVQIATVRAGNLDLNTEMAAGRVDLAIGAFDDVSTGWYQRRLFEQHYVSLFRNGHALSEGKPGLREFQAAQHLIVDSLESPYDKINQKLEQAGFRGTYRVPHFTAVPYILSSTDLVVTVPQKLAERAATPFNLSYLRPPLRLPALQTNIFWHRRYNQDPGNVWLRGFIATHFSE
ncbi:LysR family transcriptional regulator [Herbaspirillum sp. RTI4]|uniref:LysR family transcriptional regulator n=1 Tax=Herbaspirillum sp. RTI4 TaxID=3048640 RepID=UPI002AB39A17|nr:LysR family transcriptional regulator [Herbaspirillum sp. RTI4]MDY7577795.1 LysR family transcriptional regulator [Herbaspirillum sp. RTI4]MEA9980777.1 LysR family transcriptional regulator [Herbaspirillum sp. RTI4]